MKNKVKMNKVRIAPDKVVEVLPEQDYRQKLINVSKMLGCEQDLLQIFAKYDNLLKNCRNEKEAQAISAIGVMDVSRLLDNGYVGLGGNVSINDKIVIDDTKDKS